MFWLIWQMGLFLLIAFAGGLFAGWQIWSSKARSAEADNALAEVAKMRRENEVLARRLGEAEAQLAPFEAEPVSEPVAVPSPTPVAEASKQATPKPKPTSKPVSKPKPKAATKQPADDDLLVIKGLGPKAADALKAGGVTSYAAIASWSDADIAIWDETLNARGRIGRDDWVGQAKKLV